ncbi:MAG: hypothetical protein HY567_00445 [Candidatus Kerfeldbacteria bacterium]|nr:hypothetical protein [Candidatus Kerfeldbacteria bacterium]
MDAPAYLEGKLRHCTAYELTKTDRAVLERDGTEAFIYKVLTSKKFRKWSIDETTQNNIKKAIQLNLAKNEPIKLTFPFGAYKLWRLPSTPEVDWAEFFTFSYYCQYVAPVLQAYQPGVLFSFSSDDVIVERMNNVPHTEPEAYIESFKQLLENFRKYFPPNMKMELVRVADMYPDKSEYERELAEQIQEYTKTYAAVAPKKREAKNKSSELNIRWDGVRDLTGLSDQEKREIIDFGPILHDAHCAVSRRRAFVRGANKIVIFSNPINNAIPIGTTKSSRTKFWTGFGVLEQRDEKFYDRILSPGQLEQASNEDHDLVPIDLIPLKNFANVWVFRRPFDYSS